MSGTGLTSQPPPTPPPVRMQTKVQAPTGYSEGAAHLGLAASRGRGHGPVWSYPMHGDAVP